MNVSYAHFALKLYVEALVVRPTVLLSALLVRIIFQEDLEQNREVRESSRYGEPQRRPDLIWKFWVMLTDQMTLIQMSSFRPDFCDSCGISASSKPVLSLAAIHDLFMYLTRTEVVNKLTCDGETCITLDGFFEGMQLHDGSA